MIVPSIEELAVLEELITRHVTTGSGETVIRFLIADFRKSKGKKKHVSSAELFEQLPHNYRADALGSLMKNLRLKVPRLFLTGLAKDHPIKAWIDPARGNYAIHFGLNQHKPDYVDLEKIFWAPYFKRDKHLKPIRVFYPEPQFFRDRRDTYIRNPAVMTKDDIHLLSYLYPDGELRESFSFVPAGIVRAMLALNDFFQSKGLSLASTAVRPRNLPEDDDEDIIILGTPTSNGMIPLKESDLPFRVTAEAVLFPSDLRRGHKIYSQAGEPLKERYSDERNDSPSEKKWGVVTRCEHLSGRTMTIISAKHGRTVQAMVRFLTRNEDLKDLFHRVGESAIAADVPASFQALLQVETRRETGEARIGAIHTKVVIDLDYAPVKLRPGRQSGP